MAELYLAQINYVWFPQDLKTLLKHEEKLCGPNKPREGNPLDEEVPSQPRGEEQNDQNYCQSNESDMKLSFSVLQYIQQRPVLSRLDSGSHRD